MVGFLQALGAAGQGFTSGFDAAQNLRARAMQIQQAQMALDQEKRKLAAGAAIFAQQQNPMQPGGPQSPPPGQPPTAGGTQPSQIQQGPMPPSAGPAMSSPPPGAGASAAPAATGPGGGTMQPQGQPQGFDPTQIDPNAMLDRMIDQVNQRYPQASPETKLAILQERLDLLGKVMPAMRPVTQLITTQMREQGAETRTEEQVAGRAHVAEGQEKSREGIAASNREAALNRTQMQIQGATDRVKLIQDRIDARQKAGQIDKAQAAAQKAVVSDLQKQLQDLTSRYNNIMSNQPMGTNPKDVPAIADPKYGLQKQIDAVTAKMARAEKVYGGQSAMDQTLKQGDQPGTAAGSQSGGFSATPVQ